MAQAAGSLAPHLQPVVPMQVQYFVWSSICSETVFETFKGTLLAGLLKCLLNRFGLGNAPDIMRDAGTLTVNGV